MAFIRVLELQEPRMGGCRFTWIGPGGLKLSKLDRFLLSRELAELWLDMAVVALDRFFLDHCPILLKYKKVDYGPIPFRFFNHWLHLDGFKEMVGSVWNSSKLVGSASFILKEKLKLLKMSIKVWREANRGAGVKEVKEAREEMV